MSRNLPQITQRAGGEGGFLIPGFLLQRPVLLTQDTILPLLLSISVCFLIGPQKPPRTHVTRNMQGPAPESQARESSWHLGLVLWDPGRLFPLPTLAFIFTSGNYCEPSLLSLLFVDSEIHVFLTRVRLSAHEFYHLLSGFLYQPLQVGCHIPHPSQGATL